MAQTLTIVSGTATDEQNLVDEIDLFLVGTIGWTKEDTITDTASDKDIVLSSVGESESYDKLYIRVRGTTSHVRFYAYSDWDSSSSTGTDEIFDSTETRIEAGSTLDYWIAADKDVVHIISSVSPDTYHGGFGYWKTYYDYVDDPKPFFVFGQDLASDNFDDEDRLWSYGVGSFGSSYITSLSGTQRAYRASHNADVDYANPQSRTGEPRLFEPVFYHEGVGLSEIRGEVWGLYLIGGSNHSVGDILTISGSLDQNGDYLIMRYDNSQAWAIGPVVASGTV